MATGTGHKPSFRRDRDSRLSSTSGGQPDRTSELESQGPTLRSGSAMEVAAAILWLLSDEASRTTGAAVNVAGWR